MNTIRRLAGVAILVGLAAPAASAQQHGGGHGSGEPGMMGGNMGAMMEEMHEHMAQMGRVHALAPDRLLQQKSELQLTPSQVTQLEALTRMVTDAKAKARATHDARHESLFAELGKDTPDGAVVERLAREAMSARAEAHGVELGAAARAKALLTPAQREKLESSAAHGGHQGARQGQQHQQHQGGQHQR